MYDRTGLSTKCTLMKTGFKIVRTGTKAKFRPFVDALLHWLTLIGLVGLTVLIAVFIEKLS